MEYTVATPDEIQPGDRTFVSVDGKEITVLNVDGEYYALRNFCPHMEGPVGRGPVESGDCDTPRIACPFHGWTFDVDTGETDLDNKKRLTTYDVKVVDDEIRVDM